MKALYCEQRSAEWFEARCGRVTSSRVADAMAFLSRKSKNGEKGDEAQARKNLKAGIVAEILTGIHQEHYVSDPMKFGAAQEPFARAAYEQEHNVLIDQVGFVIHPTIERAGASPDGLLGKDGLIEIKAPNTTTHLDYIIGDVVPEEYKMQMLWQMRCCERQWCEFVSYDPRLPDYLQLFVKRFERNDEAIAIMDQMVQQFLSEVDGLISRLPKAPAKQEQSLDAINDELQAMWISEAEVQAHNSRA